MVTSALRGGLEQGRALRAEVPALMRDK